MKTKITLLVCLFIVQYGFAQITVRNHTATVSNTSGNRTLIDLGSNSLNNNPNLKLFIQRIRKLDNSDAVVNKARFSYGYDTSQARYYIENNDPSKSITLGACFVVDVHSNTDGATITINNPDFPYDYVVNEIYTKDANAKPKLQPVLEETNPIINDVTSYLYFNFLGFNRWNILTGNTTPFSIGGKYNILDFNDYFIGNHTSTPANIDGFVNSVTDFANWTSLDFTEINNNPNMFVFIQLFVETGQNIYSFLLEFSVFYNVSTGFWEIHSELENYISGFSFPTGWTFYVFAIDPASLNLAENEQISTIKIFPNPTSTVFNIETQKPISEVELFNILGQKLAIIKGNGTQNLQIDVSEYNAGNYFAKVKTDNGIETIRLVKN